MLRLMLLFLLIAVSLYNSIREEYADIPQGIKKRFKDSDQNTAIGNINEDITRRIRVLDGIGKG